MPFIAIAIAVSLFLGGGAVVASHTDAGTHAIHSVSHEWSVMKAQVEDRFDGNADVEASSTTKADVNSQNDADASAHSHSNADLNTNVNGSVNVTF